MTENKWDLGRALMETSAALSDSIKISFPTPTPKGETKRIAVTGASGLVGSWFCTINQTPISRRFDLVTGHDITNRKIRDEIVKDCDVVLNLAALSGIKSCNDDPKGAKKVNEDACIDLAKAAKKAGVKRFIQASTSSVYGETSKYRINEAHPTEPRSLYGKTKLKAEKILSLSDDSFEVVILRKSNIYGCGVFSKPNTVIDSFLRAYLDKQPMKIAGNGQQKRDFLHIMDAVRLYSQIAKADKVRSGIYNVGGSETLSINQVADLINEIGKDSCGWTVPLDYVETDGGMTSHDFVYDYSKCRMEFAYKPAFTVRDYICEHLFAEMRRN